MSDLHTRIAELAAKATPGDWGIYAQTIDAIQSGGRASNAKAELALQIDQTQPIGDTLYLLSAGDVCPATTGCGPTSEANAALIVTLRNAVPEILTALRIAERVMDDIAKIAAGLSDAQREAIIEGRITECPYNHPHGTRCPNCAGWPYKKGGAEAFLITVRDYLRSQNDG